MIDIERKVFYTLQRVGNDEFGIKRRDGFSISVGGIVFYIHERGDEVVFSEGGTGVAVKSFKVSGERNSLSRAEEAVKAFIDYADDVNLVDNMFKRFTTEKYKLLRESYELMLKARICISDSESL